ncbi:hypothetical protein [Coxiella burnetii]|uniref:Uncharacterized protein n=2 Tax=Coxiella burnetii TaxID=777 RepID=Q83EL3_COXBU|nr:hypothetical protein [Coxiella burnetii]NP_819349.1 hypothetical protein CBU_0306 [Coxiella burnetii RSA 493]AAO89863.1 hypothetical protein CBU_0306 [Coxiella burnetii RSA 493]ABS77098.1 hypothetical protein CBUD_1775 [Coxiella burnetii Dugway 5J108-111]ABX77253.1 hypothetical protein COXBURSA331_A0412 [Coxiella burnetii RSA 331]ACJ18976.1 hypothetical protein CbuG_1699 [Coxiella burnetii CbuG_Q212]ACJ19783.1 hypothetical protein CbuK_0503 [Coxiella burnetii CbuK_Q154]
MQFAILNKNNLNLSCIEGEIAIRICPLFAATFQSLTGEI